MNTLQNALSPTRTGAFVTGAETEDDPTTGMDPNALTPAQWLPILARRADLDWARIALLRSYVDGNAPMPELGKNTKEAWIKFQRESRTNWGMLIVEAVVNRMIPNGLTVGGAIDTDLAKQILKIWRGNRMESVFRDWVRFGLQFRQSFLTVWKSPDGSAVITADSPESMCVSVDPLQPWKVRAACRWWRDLDMEQDRCLVWSGNGWQMFKRNILSLQSSQSDRLPIRLTGQWDAVGEFKPTGAPPPVTVYNNPGFSGEYETHIDLINRINRGILERLTTSALQAFRQRALKGGLPQVDKDGNKIDWAAFFEPAPGVIWDLPAGIDIWESVPTDVTPMLMANKDDIRQLSAVTRTPVTTLIPDNANQTAEGADAARDGHIFKCGERLTEAKAGIQACLEIALATEGTATGGDLAVEVLFKPVDRVTVSEMYAAAMSAKNAGESWPSIARNILGYSPEQIAQDQLDRVQEAMLMQSIAPPAPPQQALPPGQGDNVTPIRKSRQRGAQPQDEGDDNETG